MSLNVREAIILNKGVKTRQLIIEQAVPLFAQKGYTAVTMKDICETTQMSRGGVYRYFSSTKSIFIEMLENDLVINRSIVVESIKKSVPAERILDVYFEHEMKNLMSENRGIYFAIHEFAFAEPDQRNRLNQRVEESIEIIKMILDYGQETEAFKAFQSQELATHIIYFMDSLKTSSSIVTLSEKMILDQINLMKELLK